MENVQTTHEDLPRLLQCFICIDVYLAQLAWGCGADWNDQAKDLWGLPPHSCESWGLRRLRISILHLGKRVNKICTVGEYVKYLKKLLNSESKWEIRQEGNSECLNEYLPLKSPLCDLRKLWIYFEVILIHKILSSVQKKKKVPVLLIFILHRDSLPSLKVCFYLFHG